MQADTGRLLITVVDYGENQSLRRTKETLPDTAKDAATGTVTGTVPSMVPGTLKKEGKEKNEVNPMEKKEVPAASPPASQSPVEIQVLNSPKPKTKKTPAAKGTRLPEDWQPNEDGLAYAAEQGVDPKAVLEDFRDHFLSLDGPKAVKLCWDSRWRKWCRDDVKYGKNLAGGAGHGVQGRRGRGGELRGNAALQAVCEEMREKIGLTREQVTDAFLNQTPPAPVDPAIERAARIRRHIAQMPLDRSLYPEPAEDTATLMRKGRLREQAEKERRAAAEAAVDAEDAALATAAAAEGARGPVIDGELVPDEMMALA